MTYRSRWFYLLSFRSYCTDAGYLNKTHLRPLSFHKTYRLHSQKGFIWNETCRFFMKHVRAIISFNPSSAILSQGSKTYLSMHQSFLEIVVLWREGQLCLKIDWSEFTIAHTCSDITFSRFWDPFLHVLEMKSNARLCLFHRPTWIDRQF